MKVLDLFSGIGGFSLGFERAGMETVAFCESETFCQSVLRKHWPDVPIHDDVTILRGEDIGSIDVICGGPPCQRTSVASAVWGYRTGETLWPEQYRLSAELQPSWVVVEQPPGHAEWENKVQDNLAGIGYDSARISAKACNRGAPHIRRRSIFLAHRDSARLEVARRSIESALPAPEGAAFAGRAWHPDIARTVRVADGVPGGVDRRKRIEALGNSFMPQIAEVIGRAIMSAELD